MSTLENDILVDKPKPILGLPESIYGILTSMEALYTSVGFAVHTITFNL